MIAGLNPYPSIKDSGNKWLGKVPSHWDVVPLFAIAKVKSIPDQEGRELLSVYLNRGVIRFSDVSEKRTNVTSEDLSKYQAVDPGDFVLNNQQAWRGSVGVSSLSGIVSPAYLVLSLNPKINTAFANTLFRERSMVSQYLVSSKGVGSIQRNLYWPHLKRIACLLPPVEEQADIVRYLDHLNFRIRRLIRAKQKLIALLEEQKQAIIHEAVTRGLDPDVPMKNSGVDWLGEVPKHWEVSRCRYLFRSITRRDRRGDEVKLSVTQKRGLVPTTEMQESSTQAKSYDTFQVCDVDDLVLNKYKAHLGVFWAAERRGLITPNYTVFKPSRSVNSKYYELLFHTRIYRDAFSMVVYGVTEGMSPLYTNDFYSLPTLRPPLSEQKEIVDEVRRRTQIEDAAIARAEREICLLNEYRTRLTADVITGKLDVREAAAALPVVDPLGAHTDKGTKSDVEAGFDELAEPSEEIEV